MLNKLIIYFFIPIITLYYVPDIEFHLDLIWLSITPFIVYGCSFLFIKLLSKPCSIDRKTEGALIMSCGIGSTSFVGFPIFELLYGAEGLAYGIVLSLAGTIFVFNTLGVMTGLYYAEKAESYKKFIYKVVTFPPFIAFLVAVIINIANVQLPDSITYVLAKLSAPFSVLALLTIGMQIELSIDRPLISHLMLGQVFKLLIAPIIIYILMIYIVGMNNLVAKICILGAAIGSMNAVSILAAQLGLNPRLVTLMPAIGIPVSVPLLFFVDFVLNLIHST